MEKISCLCHYDTGATSTQVGETEILPVKPFTAKTWNKVLVCAEKWYNLQTDPEFLMAKAVKMNNTDGMGFGFHSNCYTKFTDTRRLDSAEKRKQKQPKKRKYSTTSKKPKQSPVKKLKQLRSSHRPITEQPSKSIHILPPVCVICRNKKYKKDPFTHIWRLQPLISCETGGALLQAAEVHYDEDLLVHIRDKDLVSIEAKYHASCYKNYTNILYKKDTGPSKVLYTKSFQHFCSTFIDPRIFGNLETFKMNTLRYEFVKTVKDLEKIEISSSCRNSRLKRRLCNKYGDKLVFKRIQMNKCEIVFSSEMQEDQLRVSIPRTDTDGSTSVTIDDDYRPDPESLTNIGMSERFAEPLVGHTEIQELFHTAQVINKIIMSTKSITNWPPTGNDVSFEARKVPLDLFKFLAWSVDASDDVQLTLDGLPDTIKRRILSLSQDLISLH